MQHMMLDFEGIQPGESLTRFIDRVINPDTLYLEQCGKTINTVAEALKSKAFDFNVMRVIKGGSLGKGTGVRNLSDVDLLFPISTITSVEDLRKQLPSIQERIVSTLTSTEFHIRNIKTTPFTVQFEILIGDLWQEVDVLPIANITSDPSNPTQVELSTIYSYMRSNPELRDYYGKCLAPIQVDFVNRCPEKIKRAIRALKYWVKTKHHKLSSFAVELLIIKSWEDLWQPQPGNVSEERLLTVAFGKLKEFGSLQLSWTKHYNPINFDLPNPPYILDPANPYNNACGRSTVSYWTAHAVSLESSGEIQRMEREAGFALQCFR